MTCCASHSDKIAELLGDFGNDDSMDASMEEDTPTPRPKRGKSTKTRTVAPIKIKIKKKGGRRRKGGSVRAYVMCNILIISIFYVRIL